MEDEDDQVLLPQWSPAHLGDEPFTCILYGHPRSGKTYLMIYLLKLLMQKRAYNTILLFTSSEDVKDDFAPFIGRRFCFGSFNEPETEQVLTGVVQRAKMQIINYRKDHGENERCPKELITRTLLLFDDIIDESQKVRTNKFFQMLGPNFRHYNISYIISTQYPRAIQKMTRELCEYAMIFQPYNVSEYKYFRESYFPNARQEEANQLIDAHTGNHQMVVVHLRDGNRHYTFKAP